MEIAQIIEMRIDFTFYNLKNFWAPVIVPFTIYNQMASLKEFKHQEQQGLCPITYWIMSCSFLYMWDIIIWWKLILWEQFSKQTLWKLHGRSPPWMIRTVYLDLCILIGLTIKNQTIPNFFIHASNDIFFYG